MKRTPDGTRVSDYDYRLAPERIARYPARRRDESRLMVLPPEGGTRHMRFREVVDLFRPADLLVVNESRVLPARLLGRKPTGAPSEVLLVRPAGVVAEDGDAVEEAGAARASVAPAAAPSAADPYLWEALVRPGSKLKPGRRVLVGDELEVEILDSVPGGGRLVRLVTPLKVEEALERYGHIPLPPYLDREDEPLDRERYQTVYARTPGSVAAPTAGLHFTREVLSALEEGGVTRAEVTLHVGIGTFRPVEAEDPRLHEMHAEWYHVPEATARAVAATRERGGRVWAVGTTATRTLESAADEEGRVRVGSGTTRLFIHPPYVPRVVDCLITNFHLPRSTLLMLVAAFAGYERTMAAYAEAVREGYRFYSYGDAMAILRDVPGG
ncbi:MAG: tRNA preQ1(34) S-adenosylmethionine ribosyltransferase-isomerase QueA [Gemmatimonadota bacterium]